MPEESKSNVAAILGSIAAVISAFAAFIAATHHDPNPAPSEPSSTLAPQYVPVIVSKTLAEKTGPRATGKIAATTGSATQPADKLQIDPRRLGIDWMSGTQYEGYSPRWIFQMEGKPVDGVLLASFVYAEVPGDDFEEKRQCEISYALEFDPDNNNNSRALHVDGTGVLKPHCHETEFPKTISGLLTTANLAP